MNAEETKRWKAKNLRDKKPIVKDLNLYGKSEMSAMMYNIILTTMEKPFLMRWMEMKRMPMNLG